MPARDRSKPRPRPSKSNSRPQPGERPEKKPKPKARRAPRFSAKTSDKYELYQLAVQSPEYDIAFLVDEFKKLQKRTPLHFREDFCGTAYLSSVWVQQSRKHTAEGFDLDPEPIAWGREHNLAPIGRAAAGRVTLHLRDARARGQKRPDVHVVQNFSYCIFKERRELLAYFRGVRRNLAPGGMFGLDLYGGLEATEKMREERKIDDGFTYVWEQARYLPGNGDYLCHIHFRFRDGTRLRKVFTYDWRYWTLPELKDLLHDAGFGTVRPYFEQSEGRGGKGNGDFEYDPTGASSENCAGWIAYLLAFA